MQVKLKGIVYERESLSFIFINFRVHYDGFCCLSGGVKTDTSPVREQSGMRVWRKEGGADSLLCAVGPAEYALCRGDPVITRAAKVAFAHRHEATRCRPGRGVHDEVNRIGVQR